VSPTSGFRSAEFDDRAATATFDALERSILLAVSQEEYEVAAEYADALLYLSDQLEEFHKQHRDRSDRLADKRAGYELFEREFCTALAEVASWAEQNDHPVSERFDANWGEIR